jgi:hypothetical protein
MNKRKPSERISEEYVAVFMARGSHEEAKDAALNLSAEILDELHSELVRLSKRKP